MIITRDFRQYGQIFGIHHTQLSDDVHATREDYVLLGFVGY
jgi:hypothetical protein